MHCIIFFSDTAICNVILGIMPISPSSLMQLITCILYITEILHIIYNEDQTIDGIS